MTEDHLLDAWYRYASKSPGFIGFVLQAQRVKAMMTREQQRAMIGLLDETYDHTWLRLQAMRLPREDRFMTDLARIVVHVTGESGPSIDLARLAELISSGQQ
jgi:hypothetical protein